MLPHCVQQSHGECARSHARFQHARAGENIGVVDDRSGVFGVDHGGTARHRHDVVDLEGTQHLELTTFLGGDDLSIGTPDEIVVENLTAVCLEASTRHQNDGVQASLGVAYLHAIAFGQQASPAFLSQRVSCVLFAVHPFKGIALCPQLSCGIGQISVELVTVVPMVPTPPPSRAWYPALSVSRAKEYRRCPLQFRLHVVDRIKEPPTQATTMGTVIHEALDRLFDLPASKRTAERGLVLLDAAWEEAQHATPDVLNLFADESELRAWRERMSEIFSRYFTMESPQFLEPAGREQLVEATTRDGIRLRGFIDRVDRAPGSGALRVIDYKTGKAPAPRFQDDAIEQMRFYALLLELTDRLPARTQLLYLASGKVLTFDPSAADTSVLSDQITHLWEQIENDATRGYFPPRKNPLCNWCGVRSLCPQFDGVTPDLPEEGVRSLLEMRVS